MWADPALMLQDSVYFAYFSPYTLGRHQQLIADMQCSPRVALQVLGQTLDGHDLDLLRLGEPLIAHYFSDTLPGPKARWLERSACFVIRLQNLSHALSSAMQLICG